MMRSDVKTVVDALDAKARAMLGLSVGVLPSSLNSLGSPRHFTKTLGRLHELIGEEQVLAIAPACPTLAEAYGRGKVLGGQRLLVLTDDTIWEVSAGGRLSGSRPQGIATPLATVVDVRARTERLAAHAGLRKTRFLSIDSQRAVGLPIETREHDILTDRSFELFVAALERQLDIVRAAVDELLKHEEDELARKIATAARPVPVPSLADEVAKLAALRDQGAITDQEFAAMKAQLIA